MSNRHQYNHFRRTGKNLPTASSRKPGPGSGPAWRAEDATQSLNTLLSIGRLPSIPRSGPPISARQPMQRNPLRPIATLPTHVVPCPHRAIVASAFLIAVALPSSFSLYCTCSGDLPIFDGNTSPKIVGIHLSSIILIDISEQLFRTRVLDTPQTNTTLLIHEKRRLRFLYPRDWQEYNRQ